MSIYLKLNGRDGEHFSEIGPGAAWENVAEWLRSLPEQKYPAAVAFGKKEVYADTKTLAYQLESALKSSRPKTANVNRTVNIILDSLGCGRPGETASVVS